VANGKEVPRDFDCSRAGGHTEAYLMRMMLGFPVQEVLGGFEARIDAAGAKELEIQCLQNGKADPVRSIDDVQRGVLNQTERCLNRLVGMSIVHRNARGSELASYSRRSSQCRNLIARKTRNLNKS
jgi:hypothetical protein